MGGVGSVLNNSVAHGATCVIEIWIYVAHGATCAIEIWISVAHGSRCATESHISMVHVAPCVTERAPTQSLVAGPPYLSGAWV